MADVEPGPVASAHSGNRVRDRLHPRVLRVRGFFKQRMRGSFSIVVKVEHSMSLFLGYAGLGAALAYLVGR